MAHSMLHPPILRIESNKDKIKIRTLYIKMKREIEIKEGRKTKIEEEMKTRKKRRKISTGYAPRISVESFC